MSAKGTVVLWLVMLIAMFGVFYILTGLVVTRVIADLKVTETGYTSLEVKDNYGTQTDNHYKVQPADSPQQ